MNIRTTSMILACGLAAWPLTVPATGSEVYQWTDENGVVHFSQWAPEEDVEGVKTVRVDGSATQNNGIGVSEADDPDGYQAHREEMDALWADLEARREAAREREVVEQTTEVVYFPYEVYDDYPYFYPGLGLRPPRPDPPPMRPRPHPQPLPSVPFKRP